MLTRRAILAGFAAAIPARPLIAAEFPDRTITIVVPYPAGGPSDFIARLVAQGAATNLAQSIVIDNRSGGSSVIGTVAVARAQPDGYTLVLGTNQTHITNQLLLKNCPYDGIKDFAPITIIGKVPHVLVARKDLPADSAAALVALAKRAPAPLTCGSTGNGSASHLTAELFKVKTGIDLLHVPFRGAAPLMTELLAGRIDISFATLPSVAGQIDADAIKAIALASNERSARLSSIPMLMEAGIHGVEADAWFALFAPAKTPRPIIDRLYAAFAATLRTNTAKSALETQGMVATLPPPQEFTAMLPEELARWAAVIKTAQLSVE